MLGDLIAGRKLAAAMGARHGSAKIFHTYPQVTTASGAFLKEIRGLGHNESPLFASIRTNKATM